MHRGQTPDFPGPRPASAGSSRCCFLWKPLRLSAGCGCARVRVRVCVRVHLRLTTRATCSDPQVSRSACLMTTQLICKLLRSREAAAAVDVRAWPPILDTGQSSPRRTRGISASARPCVLTARLRPADDLPKKRPAQIYKPSNPDTLAYLDFSVSTTGMLAGVKVRVASAWRRGTARGGAPGTRRGAHASPPGCAPCGHRSRLLGSLTLSQRFDFLS